MPLTIWIDAVLSGSRASVDDIAPFRDRVVRAYNAGETVDMMVSEVKLRVRQRRIVERADGEERAARQMLKVSR